MSAEESLPAVGQGAVGIECRLDDDHTRQLLAPLNHRHTELRVCAERAMNIRLEGVAKSRSVATLNWKVILYGYGRWWEHLMAAK